MQSSSPHENDLQLIDVVISLNGKQLISISSTVNRGSVLTVMGPSGSGKSTLLAFIGGFLDPVFDATGQVILNGRDITLLPAEQRQVGILFQDPLLFPHMSVGGNLMFAIPASVKGAIERRRFAEVTLDKSGLSGFFDRDPATLSGGQKSRIALMRVLLAKPQALLLDEPFSKLDTERRDHIRKFVFGEARQQNLPVLLVTHDQADADAADGRIYTLSTD